MSINGKDKIYIRIPARRLEPTDKAQVIRVSADAYNVLVDIYNQSNLSLNDIASAIIEQASEAGLIVLDKENAQEE